MRLRLARARGVALKVRAGTRDADAVREAVARDDYGLLASRVASLPRPLILDVGAHIGSFSAFAAKVNPRARLVACEAHPENCALLRGNLAGTGAAVLEGAVVGSSAREGRFLDVSLALGARTWAWSRWTSGQDRVRTIDFGALLRRLGRVHFLKMDCEGCEHDIARHCAPQAFRAVDRLAVEIHHGPGVDADSFLARFAGAMDVVARRRCGRTLTLARLLRRGVDAW